MSITRTPIVEGFSITHAQICDGTKTFLQHALAQNHADGWDIYGVDEGSLDPDFDSWANEGDDTEMSTWWWLNGADVDISGGYISFPVLSNLTGRPIDSSGTGIDQIFETDLWHEDSFNIAPRPVLLKMPSKDKNGVPGQLTIGLYKVAFSPIGFDGPKYKDGLKVKYKGRALMSDVDEKGAVFADAKRRVGRLIAHR